MAIEIDDKRRGAILPNGDFVPLTPGAFATLRRLRALSSDEYLPMADEAIRVAVSRLRRALREHAQCLNKNCDRHIETRRHHGVRLCSNNVDSSASPNAAVEPHGERAQRIRRDAPSETLTAWLINQEIAKTSSATPGLEGLPDPICWIGNSALLVATASKTGFEDVLMRPLADAPIWAEGTSTCTKQSGDLPKACPVHIIPPLSDRPTLEIGYVRIWFSWAETFQKTLQGNDAMWNRLAPNALALDRRRTALPDILCLHVVVLVRLEDGSRYVLLTQRARKDHVTAFPETWCVSIEEQFRPGTSDEEVASSERDSSLLACVQRGLREELGESLAASAAVEVHGLFVDTTILQTFVVAIAEVVSQDFDSASTSLRTADDRAEFQAAVLVPFTKDSVWKLFCSRKVPLDYLRKHGTWLRGLPSTKASDQWHPTSLCRLAAALWRYRLDQPSV